jgi:type IV pilus assembly protein PilM
MNFSIGKKQSNLVGVDISSTSVKLLELSRTNSGYRIESYAVEPLPANAMNDKSLQDVEAVGEAIKRALKRSGSKKRFAAVAVPSAMVITKVIQMPAGLKPSELEAQIQLEADQYIPYSLDEVNLDHQVIGPNEHESGSNDVLLVASRSENVEERTAACEIGGLTAKVVDIEPYTIEHTCKLIQEQTDVDWADKTIAVLDIGATMTSLSVFRNDSLVYTREQPFGGKQLTEEIMRRYGLSYEDAGRVKRVGGLPDNYEPEILDPFKDQMVQQANRFLQFFFSADQNDYVDQILLAGGCAEIPGIADLIEAQIGTPTTIANPFHKIDCASGIAQQRLMSDGPAMMIACGLATRGFE